MPTRTGILLVIENRSFYEQNLQFAVLQSTLQSCAAHFGTEQSMDPMLPEVGPRRAEQHTASSPTQSGAAVGRSGISNMNPYMRSGRLQVPKVWRAEEQLKPSMNPFLDRMEHQGMKKILVRVCTDASQAVRGGSELLKAIQLLWHCYPSHEPSVSESKRTLDTLQSVSALEQPFPARPMHADCKR